MSDGQGKTCLHCGSVGHVALDCSGALLALTSSHAHFEKNLLEGKSALSARPTISRVRVFNDNCVATIYHFEIPMPEADTGEKIIQSQVLAEIRKLGVPASEFNPNDGVIGYLADSEGWPESEQGGSVEFEELPGRESFGVLMNHP